MLDLEMHAVSKFYHSAYRGRVTALADVSCRIAKGSFAVLIGPSGSGKTTLLALLGALDRPSKGQVCVGGQELGRYSESALARMRRRLGFIFQDFGLIPGLSVWENVTYHLVPRGLGPKSRWGIAREQLERFGMSAYWGERAGKLSGGEQQRVAIARALAGDPDVLFADEPTSNLDASNAEVLHAVLLDLHGRGKTIMLATHDPALIQRATLKLELEAGRLNSVT